MHLLQLLPDIMTELNRLLEMYEIFNENKYIKQGLDRWPQFELIRRTYLRELYKLQEYYHNRVYAVKSNHLLAYILADLDVPMSYSDDRYVEVCRARADITSRATFLTSDTHYGKLHNGVFYGPGTTEIIYSVDEYFDTSIVRNNWKDVIAVRPLLHPRSDLRLMLPNGKKSGNETGLAAISINIPMLALQYKYFSLDQYANKEKRDSLLGVTHFIHMYVLPNMMGYHLDIVIFNRLMNLFYGKPMGVSFFKHAFNIIDYSSKIDYVLKKELEVLKTTPLLDISMINETPAIYSSSMISALHMPDITPTRQSWWSLLLSRLSIMKFIIDIGATASDRLNMSDIVQLQISLKRLLRENIYPQILPRDLLYETNETIDEILNIN